ncbi:MAG: ABC transporter ATP-binding protein [Hyphomicrobiales bacterium]|nr:ABC transporter ATP-binding protein [Hyphomicrobiales bacterium]
MIRAVADKLTPSDIGGDPPAVELRDVVKKYRTVEAVDSLSFVVKRGSVTALLGGNGAGKTTTIAMLLGLVTPTAGTVRVLGADMARERGRVAHRINFESPYMDMPMRLTVRQNLTVYARLYGVRDPRQRIGAVSETLQIAELLERPTGKLSAGQKTRVGLAKAFLNAPEVLLLDEPTASLDPDTADWVRARLQDYAQARGATILLASHNMAEVERIADRVLMLQAGRLIEDASPRALIRKFGRGTLEDVFLDIVRGNAPTDTRHQNG